MTAGRARAFYLIGALLLTSTVLASMAYSFHIGRNMVERYAPLTNTALQIKYEVTVAHLWFEEIISGDRYLGLEQIWDHLETARNSVLAMLGESTSRVAGVMPLDDPALHEQMRETLRAIDDFRVIAEQRWNARAQSGIGSAIDQRFDQVFASLIESISVVEADLQRTLRDRQARLVKVQRLMGTSVVLLGMLIGFLLYRHNLLRNQHLQTLRDRESILRASEQRYQALFERSNDAIFLVDKSDGRYLDANKAAQELTGRSLQQLRRLRTSDICDDPEQASNRLQKTATLDHAQAMGVVRYVRPDGSQRTARLSVVPLDAHSAFGIARDITEEQATEQQLRRAQKMDAIGQLTGGIAHDFNNILGIILGNIDLMRHQLRDELSAKRLQTIKQSAERAAKLTKQLLGFSRSQAREVTTVNLNELIVELESLIRRSVTPSIEVVYRLSDRPRLVNIDADDFQDALLNLVLNARDAMPAGGRLQITTENRTLDPAQCVSHPMAKPGAYLVCSVSDNGGGIPSAQQERIFEPFYTTKEPGKGTGLGLSMVFGFVKRSGGHIEVRSTAETGTEISLFLPQAAQVSDSRSVLEEPPLPRAERGETILVVDDEPELRKLASRLLQELGYRTLTAADAREALRRLVETPEIELLFSDVVMPGGIDGYQLAALAVQQNPHIRILLTSGFDTKYAQADSAGAGEERPMLLQKPYDRQQLANRVHEALQQRRNQPLQPE